MKIRSRVRGIVGLLFLTILFGFAAVHVLMGETEHRSLALAIGGCLVPVILFIVLVREVLAARAEHQRALDNKTSGEVPNPTSEDIVAKRSESSR